MASETAVGAPAGAPGNRRLQRFGEADAPPAVAPCPLQEPGILLRMITPDPSPMPPPSDGPAPAGGDGGGNGGDAPKPAAGSFDRRAALAAPGLGASLAAYVLSLSAAQRQLLPFGANGGLGAALCVLLFAAGALLARHGRARLPLAGGAALLLAAAGVLQLLAAEAAAMLAVLSAALGLVAGTATLGARHVVVAAATAAAVAAVWSQMPRLAAEPLWMASIASALWSLCLVGDRDAAAAATGAPSTRSARVLFGLVLAIAVAALWNADDGAFAAWWAMAAVVGTALAAVAGRVAPLAVGSVGVVLAVVVAAVAGHHEPWRCRVLARAGGAAAIYDRRAHELQLHVGGAVVDAAGPERHEGPLLATLVLALTQPGDRVLALGAGTGQALDLLRSADQVALDVVDARPGTASLRARLRQHGPVPAPGAATMPPADERPAAIAPGLAAAAPGSRQAVVVVEPLALAHEVDAAALVAAACAVAGDGYLLQTVALDRAAASDLQRLFAAATAAAAWNGLFVVGDAAVLVSGPRPIAWSTVAPWSAWSDEARWLAHRAHCGDVADLQRALLGTLRWPNATAEAEAPTGSGRAASLGVLQDWLSAAPEVPPSPLGSTLQRWQALQAELRQTAAALLALGPDVGSRAEAQRLAARFLPIGAPTALLQAALGTAGADGVALTAPSLASRRAHALDPTFFADVPPFARELPVVRDDAGALEDLAWLPPRPRLAVACTGQDPRALALRARFPSACARALVEALSAAPLDGAAIEALRELADPFVLAEAANALAGRGRLRELLALWRADLPLPAALRSLLAGSVEDRLSLAAALRGRREPSCRAVLADLLVDAALPVRKLAAEALVAVHGELVPYDPEGPETQRAAAADRLRSLHNRAP